LCVPPDLRSEIRRRCSFSSKRFFVIFVKKRVVSAVSSSSLPRSSPPSRARLSKGWDAT
jgi:hypothetical protein